MIENPVVNDRSLFDKRRNKNCRNANSKALEVKQRRIERFVTGIDSRWRRHVIVEPAVFVVSDQQQRALPRLLVARDRLVNVINDSFAQAHVVIRMLV